MKGDFMILQFVFIILAIGFVIAITCVGLYVTKLNDMAYYTPLDMCSEQILKETKKCKTWKKIFNIMLFLEFAFLVSYIIFFCITL